MTENTKKTAQVEPKESDDEKWERLLNDPKFDEALSIIHDELKDMAQKGELGEPEKITPPKDSQQGG